MASDTDAAMDLWNSSALQRAKDLLAGLVLTETAYRDIMKKMLAAIEQGLKGGQSSMKMLASHVSTLPTGQETGRFLALDLGGTNYRVILVTMHGETSSPEIDFEVFAIPVELMTGKSEETVLTFLENRGAKEEVLALGLTFSFPCEQKGLNEAHLIRWTKGFDLPDAVDQDVGQLLQQAMDNINLKVKCVAVVNDTVGTLASCALKHKNCAIGLIVGTGTNAAYVENAFDVGDGSGKEETMVVNTEWGAFGENGELDHILTDFDRQLDKASLHPGKQIYEKLISGMYLGEGVRLALIKLTHEGLLFRGVVPDALAEAGGFLTQWISSAERDPSHLLDTTLSVLSQDLGIPNVEKLDEKIVRLTCEAFSTRAAYLAGTGIAALLWRIGREHVTVGVDGSLYRFHPRFHDRMSHVIEKLKPDGTSFLLKVSEDGSGKGAAAIAAAAQCHLDAVAKTLEGLSLH